MSNPEPLTSEIRQDDPPASGRVQRVASSHEAAVTRLAGGEQLTLAQTEHGQRAIGLDLDQSLRQRAGTGRRKAAVEDQDAGQAVAVLAEIGDHRRLPVFHQRIAQAGGVEAGDQPLAGLGPLTDLEPYPRNDRTGRAEAIAEGGILQRCLL